MQLLIIYCVIFGTTVGSFLTAVVSRQITGGSILRPARSHCDQCSRQLAWFELIPIISFIVLRGRCRTCLHSIPYHVLLAEVFAGCLMLNFKPDFHHICFIVIGFFTIIFITLGLANTAGRFMDITTTGYRLLFNCDFEFTPS